MRKTFPILFERIPEAELGGGQFYAHLPALGLTTHGVGVEGARAAMMDLLNLWIGAKREAGESVPDSTEFLVSTVEVDEDALETA